MWMQGQTAEVTKCFAKIKPMLYRNYREKGVAALQHLHGLPGEPWIFVAPENLGCAGAQKSHPWVWQN